jgi:hypothetical protein
LYSQTLALLALSFLDSTAEARPSTTTLGDLYRSIKQSIDNIQSPPQQEAIGHDTAFEGRQTIQVDRNGVQLAFGFPHLQGLVKAFLWQAYIFVLLQSVLFPILIHTYKGIFCSWQTNDCQKRYNVPLFEPETELVFVADKKKTIGLNKKQQMNKQTPPFKLEEGYRPLDIFPPIEDRPQPPPDLLPNEPATGELPDSME